MHAWCIVHIGCVDAHLVCCAHLVLIQHSRSRFRMIVSLKSVCTIPHNKSEISLDCINRILSQQTKHLVSLCIHDLLSETSFPFVLTGSVFFVAIHLDLTTLWCVVVGVWRLKSRLHIF